MNGSGEAVFNGDAQDFFYWWCGKEEGWDVVVFILQ